MNSRHTFPPTNVSLLTPTEMDDADQMAVSHGAVAFDMMEAAGGARSRGDRRPLANAAGDGFMRARQQWGRQLRGRSPLKGCRLVGDLGVDGASRKAAWRGGPSGQAANLWAGPAEAFYTARESSSTRCSDRAFHGRSTARRWRWLSF
jgi:hypothetical protein